MEIRRGIGWIACVILSIGLPESGAAQETERVPITELVETFSKPQDLILIDNLRKRRLFDLADRFCKERLADPALPPTERSLIVMEQIKNDTTQAVFSSPSTRKDYWDRIDRTVEQFLSSSLQGPPPRSFMVRVQGALAHVAHANLIRQELAAELVDESGREESLEALRTARSLLDQIQRDIDNEIPNRRNQTLADGQLSSAELLTLATNVQYQMALCNLERAQLYRDDEEGRLGRIDALNQVEAQLLDVSRNLSQGQSLWWETKISQVHCLRLLDRLDEANAMLVDLAQYDVPESVSLQLIEQKIRLAIAMKDATAMQQLLQIASSVQLSNAAEFDVTLLETMVELSLRSNVDSAKERWMATASQFTKAIEQRHGPYWGRRAELILIGSLGGKAAGNGGTNSNGDGTAAMKPSTELDLLIRVAGDASRKNRHADAIRAFDRAIEVATSNGNAGVILTLQVQAGQSSEVLGDHRDAAKRMTETAERFPTNSLASAAHLRGCWNIAQVLNAQPVGSEQEKEARQWFQSTLNRHLELWPQSATIAQAAIWSGDQLVASKEYRSAFDRYLKVPATSDEFADAIERASSAADRWLASSVVSQRQSLLSDCLKSLRAVRSSLNQAGQPAIRCRIQEIHLILLYSGQRNPEDTAWLEKLAGDPQLNSAFNSTVAPMLVATRGFDPTSKQQLLEQISQWSTLDNLNRTARYLDAAGRGVGVEQEQKQVAGELQVAVADQALKVLTASKADAAVTTIWEMRRAEFLSSLGRYDQAIAQLESLETRYPKKADIKMKLARAMTSAYLTSAPEKALNKWRQIAAKLRSGSENWFEAKLNVAKLLIASGDRESALKLLKFMQISPGWSESTFAKELDQALNQALREAGG